MTAFHSARLLKTASQKIAELITQDNLRIREKSSQVEFRHHLAGHLASCAVPAK